MMRPLAVVALALLLVSCAAPSVETPAPLPTAALDADAAVFLDTLQVRTFRWFWETTNPETGLVHDRWPTRHFSSIAAIGFGLTAYGIGAERGYVTREEAAERTLTTLRFLWERPQGPQQVGVAGYKGFFYHFLEYGSGLRYRDVELSTIDTALLMGGVLFAREYFDGDDGPEIAIRAYADSLYQRVEWDWFRKPGEQRLTMGWYPEVDFGRAIWQGYNEAMILYILGFGSPTFPLEPEVWDEWTETYDWATFYGYEHVNFTPLFGHQYSHLWIDFREIQDAYMREKGIDYFENSRRATLSNRAYCIDNPAGWKDYGENVWGLTACDGPWGGEREYNGELRRFHRYSARGASAERIVDDGTITPTAAGGSIPFAPEVAIPALMEMAERYGDRLWTPYGFRDAFNPSFTFTDVEVKQNSEVTPEGWFDHDYLGIDQGPILIMAENYRTGLVWETMKKSPYIVHGLERAGFTGGWLDERAMPSMPGALITGRQPGPETAREGKRLIVVLGSSTAAGVGPERAENTWVNRYRAYVQAQDPTFDVLNLARGGYTTYRLLPTGTPRREDRPPVDTLRNVTAALQRDPAALIINLPSNDTAAGYTVQEQLANYDRILAEAEAAGVPVWVTTTLPRDLGDEDRRELMALRDSTFARFGDRAIDIWTGIALEDGRLDPRHDSGDHLHLNDAAHAILFDRVRAAALLDALKGDR
ncbi:MAG: glucoamylase family protein [Rhodothermales bacterium]|nr:glucoamylase family protein [Rhodothermales bacterium]